MKDTLLGIVWYVICYNLPGYWKSIYFIGVLVYMIHAAWGSNNKNLLGEYTHKKE